MEPWLHSLGLMFLSVVICDIGKDNHFSSSDPTLVSFTLHCVKMSPFVILDFAFARSCVCFSNIHLLLPDSFFAFCSLPVSSLCFSPFLPIFSAFLSVLLLHLLIILLKVFQFVYLSLSVLIFFLLFWKWLPVSFSSHCLSGSSFLHASLLSFLAVFLPLFISLISSFLPSLLFSSVLSRG